MFPVPVWLFLISVVCCSGYGAQGLVHARHVLYPEPAPGLSVFIKRLVQVVTGRQGEDRAACWVECERKDR